MNSHSRLQKAAPKTSDHLTTAIQLRPFSSPKDDQPQATSYDFSHVDLFSHAPQRPAIQPKLTVGAPNSQYERVAEQVMSMPDSTAQPPIQRQAELEDEEVQTKPSVASITPGVQRESLPEEEELQTKRLDHTIQRESLPKEEEEPIQAKRDLSTINLFAHDPGPRSVRHPSLQAKMDSFWTQRMERATEPTAPVQPNAIQAKGTTTGDRPDSSVAQRPNNTGMPDALKAGVESLSGYSLDDVRVHYNSPKPTPLQALAYTQGTEIHVAPGQEEHLPHEAWHVVQQMQGRVKPTMQMMGSVNVNDDARLEQEADEMGVKSARNAVPLETGTRLSAMNSNQMPVQRVFHNTMADMWGAVEPTQTEAQIKAITDADPALAQVYTDVEAHLANMDFIYSYAKQPEASMVPSAPGIYEIKYGLRGELQDPYNDTTRYVGAILHEMMHITTGLQFATNVPATGGVGHVANMNLPVAQGQVAPADAEYGLTANQFDDLAIGAAPQLNIMCANWDHLSTEADFDEQNGSLTQEHVAVIKQRIDYAKLLPGALAHYDTVLTDLLYYLRSKGADQSRAYEYAHRMLTEANARRLAAVGAVQAIPRAPLPIPAPPQQSFFQYLFSCFSP